jgi:hypothetical protein
MTAVSDFNSKVVRDIFRNKVFVGKKQFKINEFKGSQDAIHNREYTF